MPGDEEVSPRLETMNLYEDPEVSIYKLLQQNFDSMILRM